MKSDLINLISSKKRIILCGAGGVGKTTMSAYIAILSALLGKKTCVMTVDPSKRLKDTLGYKNQLSGLGFEHITIEDSGLAFILDRRLGGGPPAASVAFDMGILDGERIFNKLFEDIVEDQSMYHRLSQNPLYARLKDVLVGSSDFLAITEISRIEAAHDYDTIILDTPPLRYMLDFLNAPQYLSRLMSDKKLLGKLLGPVLSLTRTTNKIMGLSAKFISKVLNTIIGLEFVSELVDFSILFECAFSEHAIKAHADRVDGILKDPQTAFVAVTIPTETRIRETIRLASILERHDYSVSGVIVNRIQSRFEGDWVTCDGPDKERLGHLGGTLRHRLFAYHKCVDDERAYLRILRDRCLGFVHPVSLHTHDIRGISDLVKLGQV